ncbi:MAG: hypothetical protein WBV82_13810 [Myxococcaceae bacterium]
MKALKTALCVAALAQALAGCGVGDLEQLSADEPGVSISEQDLHESSWSHQPLNFSCTESVSNSVSASSRRHFYSFPGEAFQTVDFELTGNWPSGFGAVLVVADQTGNILGSALTSRQPTVRVQVTFSETAKYFVFVSPAKYARVNHTYGYQLTASCQQVSCQTDQDCGFGGQCALPQCIRAPCSTIGTCVARDFCAEYETSDGRFYAKNFTAGDINAAQAWLAADPQVSSSTWAFGTCLDVNQVACATGAPVCGTPYTAQAPADFRNVCEFKKAVRAEAGATGESKGRFEPGPCGQSLCATVLVQPQEPSGAPTFYAKNVASDADAQSWFGFFPANSPTTVTAGPCDQESGCIEIHAPVCGTIRYDPPQTYANSCFFFAAVKGSAGGTVGSESKGFYSQGACAASCNYDDPARNYVGRSQEVCARIRFACDPGWSYFSDECGCGCTR